MFDYYFKTAFFLFYLPFCFICNAQENQSIQSWWSSELYPADNRWFTNPPAESKIRYRLSPQSDLNWQPFKTEASLTFQINPDQKYQMVLGFGTSLEATTIYAICKNKTPEQQREILTALIDPTTGMGLNLFRITIGTSDFSDGRKFSRHLKGFYSYQDDPDLPFSIGNDIQLGILDILRMAIEVGKKLNPPRTIKFIASCWSPPGWMKASNELIGGTLKPGYERKLAFYFRQFIEASQNQGIPIYAMTLQNEPNFLPDDYPGMRLSHEQELNLVLATYEEFRYASSESLISTEIWINDHNFDYWKKADFILNSLEKAGKKHYVDAVAFHNYSNSPVSNMARLQEKHPEIRMTFTEKSEFGVDGMYFIQQYFRNWSTCYLSWVTMSTQQLDEHNQGPYNKPGELSPTLFIQKDGVTSEWYKIPEFYMLSQFSRFIQPGACRIECTPGSPNRLTAISFINPDQTIITVLVNQTEKDQSFRVIYQGKQFHARLPRKTVGTYLWVE